MPVLFFFFSSRRRHTRLVSDWSSDVCSSDLEEARPEISEGLGKDRRHVRVADERERQVIPMDELPPTPRPPLEGPAGRHEAERRHAENGLDLLRVLDARVEVLEEKGRPHAPQRSEERRVGKECSTR